MSNAARVLIVGHPDGNGENISDVLQENGFESYTGDIKDSAAELTGQRRPDIVILNMDSEEAYKDPRAFFALAQTLKESTLSSRMRVILVGGKRETNFQRSTANIDDVLLGPVQSKRICHRLNALVRLNTMHEELVRRLNTTSKYGLDAPLPSPPVQVENAKVLFMGEAISYGLIENALSNKATLVASLSFSTALNYLRREPFDTVLIDTGDDPSSYLEFINDLRRDSRLFNLPVLMLIESDQLQEHENIYRAGVTDFIEKPIQEDELRIRTFALIREMRFRESLRHIYAEAKHFATNDSLTGLYSRGFLLEHLSNIIKDVQQTSQSFSLMAIEITNIADINERLGYATGDRVVRQLGETIGCLMRGEDLSSRYSGTKFVIIFPDTSKTDAEYVLKRIIGVVHHTEFMIPLIEEPVHIQLKIGLTEFESGDTPDSIISRAWLSLDE